MTAAGPKSESRSDTVVAARDIAEARRLFPATVGRAYFNTAATGLASRRLA